MAKVRFNQSFNVNRVVKRLVRTILALYVGGTIISVFGTVMQCTSSPFYSGLSLIGWTVTSELTVDAVTNNAACNLTGTTPTLAAGTYYNVVTATSGSGVLAVVGIIAIAQIVTEFISW